MSACMQIFVFADVERALTKDNQKHQYDQTKPDEKKNVAASSRQQDDEDVLDVITLE